MTRRTKQLALLFRTHGGARKGAGRPKGERPKVRHQVRPVLSARHPVHVTLRLRREVGSLRRKQIYTAVWSAWNRLRRELGLRLVHFSIQYDHIHLIVEVGGKESLSRGMQGLTIRTARAMNRTLRRSGRVFADRYHARALTSPREVRNAIVYVLNNRRHHPRGAKLGEGFDPYSSAVWFEGWKEGPLRWPKPLTRPPPVVPPRTWLLAKSWRRHPAPSLWDVPGHAR